jgi:uncharacterized membrane protein (DUF2068 family)
MSDPLITHQVRTLDPVQADERQSNDGRWTNRLVLFLRVMAGLSLLKGLYHWALVVGIAQAGGSFEAHTMPWQATTVFFAVIDLVAAVGLWLVAAWGAVVWLTAAVSMAAVEVFFPEVYGGRMSIIVIEGVLLACYLLLAIQSAREHPQ